jgi:serine/threonine protein kinase
MSEDPNIISAKIADFGLAQTVNIGSTDIQNTWQWLPPEAIDYQSKSYDHKIDLYSFGMVLWEIVTRNLPFVEYSEYLKKKEVPLTPAEMNPDNEYVSGCDIVLIYLDLFEQNLSKQGGVLEQLPRLEKIGTYKELRMQLLRRIYDQQYRISVIQFLERSFTAVGKRILVSTTLKFI